MSYTPVDIQFKRCRVGDTWDGLTDCSFESDGNSLSSPLASVLLEFKDADGVVGLSLASSAGKITISNAALWQFQVNEVSPMTLAAGTWTLHLRTTSAAGRVKTYVSGTIEMID